MCFKSTLRAIVALVVVTSWGGTAQAGIILEHLFDDQNDPTANSGSLGAVYDGELQGSAAFVSFGGGFAISLDGDVSNNSVVIPGGSESAFDIGNADFSIEAIFQTSFVNASSPNLRGLIWKENTGNGPAYGFGVRSDTGLGSFYLADGAQFAFVDTTVALNDGSAHTLLAVREGNQIGLFVDGALNATAAVPVGFGSTNNDNSLIIGGRTLGAGDDWVGLIDEVRVYDMAARSLPVPEPSNLVLAAVGSLLLARRREHR